MRRILPALFRAALVLSALAGCAPPTEPLPPPPTQPYQCLLPSEERMLVAELFFGRNINGRLPLTDAEWAELRPR